MDPQAFTKQFEYRMAQEMLRHYDVLNWYIGSVFIAAILIFTGFVVNKDLIKLAEQSSQLRWTVCLGIPLFSLFILFTWLLWFRRHRALYNLRNEVLHRLEIQMGLYHFLRVTEADQRDASTDSQLLRAKIGAGHDANAFTPLYPVVLSKPSGYALAKVLAFGIPVGQFILLYGLYGNP